MEDEERKTTKNNFLDPREIENILREAGRQARIMHKKLGNPIASWENGRVVIIPPEEIPVDDEPKK